MMDELSKRSRNTIRSIRKGSVQWSEEDRLKIATLLLKAGYVVRLNRQPIPGKSQGYIPEEFLEWEIVISSGCIL